MKQKSLFVLLICLSVNSLFGQIDSNYVREDTLHGFLLSDRETFETVKGNEYRKMGIVFESNFDDSIEILINDSVYIRKWLKTKPAISMVGEVIPVDYSRFEVLPIVKIRVVRERKFIAFKPDCHYQLLYLNRNNNKWLLQFSNYGKDYW